MPLHRDGLTAALPLVLAGLLRLELAVLRHALDHLGVHRVQHVPGGEPGVGRGVALLDARLRLRPSRAAAAQDQDADALAELLADGARRSGLGGLPRAHLLGERAWAPATERAVREQLPGLDEARAAAVVDADGGDVDGADDGGVLRPRRVCGEEERAVAVGELEEEVHEGLGAGRRAPGGERGGRQARAEERRQGVDGREGERPRRRRRPHQCASIWEETTTFHEDASAMEFARIALRCVKNSPCTNWVLRSHHKGKRRPNHRKVAGPIERPNASRNRKWKPSRNHSRILDASTRLLRCGWLSPSPPPRLDGISTYRDLLNS